MKIQEIYQQLARFMHANALIPFNDAYTKYLDYYISIENRTGRSPSDSGSKLQRLQEVKRDFEQHLNTFKGELEKLPREQRYERVSLTPSNIIRLINELYALPISGVKIHEQVSQIQFVEDRGFKKNEIYVELPVKAANSKVMKALVAVVVG